MEQLEEYLRPVIDLLPEEFQEYWLAIFGAAALLVLLPLAWYKRRLLRALIGLPPRPVKEPPKLDEDLAQFVPPPDLKGGRRLFIEGVPARLRVVVVASPGKGTTVEESAVSEILDQVRWGLAAVARQDQAVLRTWPVQLSARGFPAVFFRHLRREPAGQPSHWLLLAGPTPPRPRSVLLGLALWTDQPTLIGHLTMEPGQWMKTLHIETFDYPEPAETPAAAAPPEPSRVDSPPAEGPAPLLPNANGEPAA